MLALWTTNHLDLMKTATITKRKRSLTSVPDRPHIAPVRIKDILVPTDFSDASREALLEAGKYAEKFGARLTVLFVVEPPVYPEFIYSPLVIENDKIVAASQDKLKRWPGENSIPPRLVRQALVRTGSPALEIVDAARTLKVDMIMIATHGRSGITRAVLGSTAERVVRHAPCPVLVLRPASPNPFKTKSSN